MKVLIKDTTKEERKRLIADGMALASLGGGAPTEDSTVLFDRYINGELELSEIEKMIIARYRNSTE